MIHEHQSEPHDDRWHYLESRDERHEENYIEWKYFNFVQDDLEGYIIYYLIDPEKKTKLGGGRLLVRVLKDGKLYGSIKKIDMDQIELDTVSASMRMGGAKIMEHDAYHYELLCDAEDMSWQLSYEQHAPSIEPFTNIHSGLMRWEKVNWLIKMPRAKVTGKVRIGKDEFEINALGYSDTNWGEMLPFFSKYEWGQFNAPDFSVVFGILYKLGKITSTYFYVVLEEKLIKLENAECEVEHVSWKKDEVIEVEVPAESNFIVRNEEYELKINTKLVCTDNPGMKVHPLLPKVVISEQIVDYQGTFAQNGKVVKEFKGRGFQEWSDRTWKDPAVEF